MKSGVTILKDKSRNLGAALRDLTMQSVYVGIPGDKGKHDGSELTNAEIGYIHETGSPKGNIPARPFLTPGIRAVQPQIVQQLRDAGQAALAANSNGVKQAYEKAGLLAQNAVRAQFVDNDWPPLAESTLDRHPVTERDDAGKPSKHGKSRRERGAINPLLDSGQLRKSVTYVVRKGR